MSMQQVSRGASRPPLRVKRGSEDGWKLDFCSGVKADGFTFNRASSAGRFNALGLWEVVGTDVMRINHDPATSSPLGVLLEGQRTNVVLHNRDLTQTAWTKTNMTVSHNQTGLDGASNSASQLTATTANATVLQSITLASSARFQTAYVKRLTGSGTVEMTMNGGSTWVAVTVTGSWTRVSIPTQTLANPSVGFRLATSGDSIAVDLVQNEDGIFASSAIATTTAAVTRSADNLRCGTLSTFGFNASEGTLLVDFDTCESVNTGVRRIAQFDGGTGNNRMFLSLTASTENCVDGGVVNGGTTQANNFSPRHWVAANVPVRAALAYKVNDIAVTCNGLVVASDTSASLPTVTRLALGYNGYDTSSPMFGHIRKVVYYPTRLPNSQLQLLTTEPTTSAVDTIIIMGQSNADGRAANSELSANAAATYAFYGNANPRLFMYYKPAVQDTVLGTLTAGSYADDGAWYNMGRSHDSTRQTTHQVIGDASSSVSAQTSVYHGLELELARQYALAYPNRELRIVKACVGSSAIEDAWKITNADSNGLWGWFTTYVYGPAVRQLAALGHTPRVIAVVWLQGEADTIDGTHASAYATRLQTMVNRCNSELGTTPLKIVIAQLSAQYDTGDGPTVKTAQATVAAANANTALLKTDGTGPDAAYAKNGDNVHFSTTGYLAMAQRVWTMINPG